MADQIIFYQFSRPAIQEGDFSDFLSKFGSEKLPKGRELANMMNGLATFVKGYDADSREIYSIPEVRAFYSKLDSVWPYWLYFGNLETEGHMIFVLCCLKSLDALAVKGRAEVQVAYDPMELVNFISRHFAPMNEMCERAGLSERQIYERTKRAFKYLGLPF
jgi:hypothetical protein